MTGIIAWEGRTSGFLSTWSREAVAALASPTVRIEEWDGALVAIATEVMPPGFPFLVIAAGSPRHLKSTRDPLGRAVLVLEGGEIAHAGTRMLVPCRLVEDTASPLRVAAAVDHLNRPGAGDDVRWVVLSLLPGGDPEAFNIVVRSLFGCRVRLEYEEVPHVS